VEWTDEQVGRAGAHVRRRLPGEEVGAGAVVSRPADHPAGGRHGRVPHPRAWVRLPAAFVRARWQPGRAALVGVVVVVALAVAVFGLRVAWERSADGGTVIAPGGGSRAGPTGVTAGAVPVGVSGPAGVPSAGATPAASPGAAPATALGASPAGVVVVHVVGRVRHPGVRQLPAGSRVADAVEAAGGATGKADLSALNLARVLVDGEQVRVPAVGDPPVTSPGPGGGGAGTGTGAGGTAGSPVPLNTADLATLDTLPGVGPVLAQRILDWRAAHGRFTSVDELGEVSGIGEKLLAQLSPLVTL
jgi:competence protein ComEA